MKRFIALPSALAVTLALTLTVTACSSSPAPAPTDTPSTVTETAPAEGTSDSPVVQEASSDDVDFLRATVVHHRQVMQRSGVLLDLPDIPAPVVGFARRQLETTGPLAGELNRLLGERRGHRGRQEEQLRQQELLDLEHLQGEDAARAYVDQMTAGIDEILPLAERSTGSDDADVAEMARRIVDKLSAERAELGGLLG